MISNVVFVTALAACLAVIMVWACKVLPRDGWQMMASVPLRKRSGQWEAGNLTYYGVLTATAAAFAAGVFLLLRASISVN